MLKVRFEAITLRVPVIDNSGEHDAKISQEEFDGIYETIERLEQLTGGRRRWPDGDPSFAQGNRTSRVIVGGPPGQFASANIMGDPIYKDGMTKTEYLLSPQGQREVLAGSAPISQSDPVIDTTVRDSEMRSSEPEMTLEELRERPEKTRSPPRPRANSWRHGNG